MLNGKPGFYEAEEGISLHAIQAATLASAVRFDGSEYLLEKRPAQQPRRTDERARCFVIMGFGKKTDFETGRVLNLDASYNNLIKPAIEAAGLNCIRADEIKHSGPIDVPMYEQLFNADVVVADLSTSNRNAIYELGVRHALRPFMKSPFFDLSHIVIRTYRHLGEDIGVSEM
jgi:hypothetical protein